MRHPLHHPLLNILLDKAPLHNTLHNTQIYQGARSMEGVTHMGHVGPIPSSSLIVMLIPD